ncbi:MAG: phospho-sugar mutase [Gordonia sp.]|nr:phospho-sugar mutase [Gordonia sp. (in: high G+C Gram-positive bacteria)]
MGVPSRPGTGRFTSVSETGGLVDAAREWIRHDPDPITRDELSGLCTRAGTDVSALAELSSRMSGPLRFGTAGLRGAVGAGRSRMNVAVVTAATAGLAAYLHDVVGPDARVVVGCDARHGSAAFTDATCGVLAGAGLRVLALPRRLPTPVTAFAVRTLGADAGIMITASHNPPADNGYKVYLGGRAVAEDHARGVQIVAPADSQIAARIDACAPADQIPLASVDPADAVAGVAEDYITRVAAYRTRTDPSQVRVVLTAMHGVGGETATRVLSRAGVDDVHVVAEQFAPDPDFSTVPFPNPEEPGALDLSLVLAKSSDADVVIALDPDADRCAVAIPSRTGSWRQLSGDELGAVLGEQAAADGARSGDTLACSIVSSRLLARIAEHHGLTHRSTLTGFKWIARTPGLRFGYEEAIGYCTDPQAVRDKDGIGAMMRVITLIESLREEGRTIEDLLDDLARRHGLHATAPLSFRVADPARIGAAMARLDSDRPTTLAGAPVTEWRDLAEPNPDLPPTEGLLIGTAQGDRVIVRPSGTEPKLKCYLEVIEPCTGPDIPHERARDRLARIAAEITEHLGLTDPAPSK